MALPAPTPTVMNGSLALMNGNRSGDRVSKAFTAL
jgi:hypothetical protein